MSKIWIFWIHISVLSTDTSAPSAKSLINATRILRRKQSSEKNTLSGYIGSSNSDRSASIDNQSVVSTPSTPSGNTSENGSEKNLKTNLKKSSTGEGGDKPEVKYCPICKKPFQKVSIYIHLADMTKGTFTW